MCCSFGRVALEEAVLPLPALRSKASPTQQRRFPQRPFAFTRCLALRWVRRSILILQLFRRRDDSGLVLYTPSGALELFLPRRRSSRFTASTQEIELREYACRHAASVSRRSGRRYVGDRRRSAGDRCWRRGRAPRELHLFERWKLIIFVFAIPYQSGLLVCYGNGVATCAAAARLTIACHVGGGCMLSSRCCGSLRVGHSQHRGVRLSNAPGTISAWR